MTALPRAGFIGLGAMGRPMALNLIRAGYAVAAYARRPAHWIGAQAHPTFNYGMLFRHSIT